MRCGIFNSYFWLWRYVTSLGLCMLGVVASCQTDLQAESSLSTQTSSPMARGQNAPDRGIRGTAVAAWGNAPANPPKHKCLEVFDADGTKLVTTATCSGIRGSFSVAMPPGHHVIGLAGGRTRVDIQPAKWVTMSPRPPPGLAP